MTRALPARKKWDGQRETLDDLSGALHYNRWIYGMMEPYLGRHILEVGCGIGNMTGLLAQEGRRVLGVDIHSGYVGEARRRLQGRKGVSFQVADLEKDFSSSRGFHPDTVVSINVLEHIREDVLFLEKCLKSLPSRGRLLIFVPALPFLYGSMDTHYGHFRRYFKDDLAGKMEANGFKVLNCRYLNLLGVLGWWWNGRIRKKAIVPKNQILLYDKVIRWVAPIEKWLPRPIGLSLFCAGEKK